MAVETTQTPAVESKAKPAPLTAKDFKGKVDPDWCPGCGDFGVLAALQSALAELGLQPHEVITISGIGCSSNLPGFIHTYGMHTLHGRAVAVASGVQLSNHSLKVIATGGDGDGYGIGGNHFIHCMRRNYDMTYLVMNNQIYGLTTGQCSPTSVKGMKTKSTPYGNVENPINPIALAIAGGATYVARGFSANQKMLVELIKGGIQHRGFALIDVFSPCVTYNKDNTYQFFRPRVKDLAELNHDPTDFHAAMDRAYEWDETIPIGLFWKREDLPALDQLEPVLEAGPLAHQPLRIDPQTAKGLIRELM
jgi:2-oxoglutarate ferredoxin oxidoreductase subunit beta